MDNENEFIDRICGILSAAPSGRVMDHGTQPSHRGIMEKAAVYAKITGPCGDTDEMFLRIHRGRVKEARFITDGCVFSTAACDAAAHLAMGKTIGECLAIDQQVILDYLEDMPDDHAHCALLASRTLHAAVKSAKRKNKKIIKTGESVTYRPIGTICSPFKNVQGMPIQPTGARGVAGKVLIEGKYRKGLKDLEGFSHIILIYHLHRTEGYALRVRPFLDDSEHGIFACRSPRRPNPIGFSVVKLIRVAGLVLHIEDVDIVDGTPLLDIKPYVPLFDSVSDVKTGWFADCAHAVHEARSDGRFASSFRE
jgi:tRNA (adenine37-N6)-methyltransferase